MNKNIFAIVLAIMMLSSIGYATAALGVGSWVSNDDVTSSITNGQTTEFRYGITAVTQYGGKYSIELYREGSLNPIYSYAKNKPTVGNGALGRFNVTPSNYAGTAGNYYVLITSVDKFSTDTFRLNLAVMNPVPSLSATCSANPINGNNPLNVQFSAGANGGTGSYTYSWTFGDGTVGNNQASINHIYNADGKYNARLTVTDTDSNSISVNCPSISVTTPITPITVSCTANPLDGYTPLNIQLNAQANGGRGTYTYTWNFGDSSTTKTTSNKISSYIYQYSGTYSTSVTVKDSLGNTKSAACGQVIVHEKIQPKPLTASCNANPTNGNAPLTVSFNGIANDGTAPYTYSWTFGDGTTGPNQNSIAHIYTAAGTFNPVLKVTDASGNAASANCGTVKINNTIPPAVNLTVTCTSVPAKGNAPLNVSISSTVIGGNGPYTYTYTYGNGQSDSSQNNLRFYTYSEGTYYPKVLVVDSLGNTGSADCGTITATKSVPPNTNLTISCSANDTTGYAPLNIRLSTAVSDGNGQYQYTYHYGNGQTTTGNNNIVYQIYSEGSYDPNVYVTDSDGNSGFASCGHIAALNNVPPNTNLTVSCYAMPQSGTVPLSVTLTSYVSGGAGPYMYTYDYASNGYTTTGNNNIVEYTYYVQGLFHPNVNVQDSMGNTGSAACGLIFANPSNTNNTLSANAGGPYNGYTNEALTLDASLSTGAIVRYSWDFGDGTTMDSSTPVIQHAYNHVNIYTVKLTVYDMNGASSIALTTAKIVDRTAPPKPVENNTSVDEGLFISHLLVYGDHDDVFKPNDDVNIDINVKNYYDKKLDNVRVTVMIPELGIEARSESFDLNHGKDQSESLILPLEGAAPGIYYVKIIVGNDDVVRTKYREITVKK